MKRIVGLCLTKQHVQSIWKRAVENEWHFLPALIYLMKAPAWSFVRSVWCECSQSGYNVDKWVNFALPVSSLSWPMYDKKHFAKKQLYLLAQVMIGQGGAACQLPSSTAPTFSWATFLWHWVQFRKQAEGTQGGCCSLKNCLAPSPCSSTLLAWNSFPTVEVRRFLHHNEGEGAEGKQLFCDTSCWCSPHWGFWGITSVLWILKIILVRFGFFVVKNTTDNSGHSFSGNSITQLPWRFFAHLLSAAPLLLSSKCDKQCR